MDEAYIAAYGGRGALLDLSTQSSRARPFGRWTPKVLDTGKVGGTLVGAPVGVALFSVGVNPELLKQAGLKMPNDKTWTWDDLADHVLDRHREARLEGRRRDGLLRSGCRRRSVSGRASTTQEVFPTEGQTRSHPGDAGGATSSSPSGCWTPRRPRRLAAQVENTTAALDAQPIRHEHGRVPPAVPHPDRRVRRRQRQRPAVAEAARAGKSGESPRMVNKASMYWSLPSRGKHPAEAAKLVSFLLTDPAAVKILKVERGVPAIPAVQSQIKPVLDATGKMSLAFAQDLQDEVVPPPQVTPQNASGYGGGGDPDRH